MKKYEVIYSGQEILDNGMPNTYYNRKAIVYENDRQHQFFTKALNGTTFCGEYVKTESIKEV